MSIYQHYRKFEHPFVDGVLSWMEQVERTYTPYVTDFLDPREQEIISSIIGSHHDVLQYRFFGGYERSERKRCCIAPFYEEISTDTFRINLLEGTYPQKFVTLKHGDVLGTLMSLGIDRRTIGDILVKDGVFQFFITDELTPYVEMNLTQVKQATTKLESRPFEELIDALVKWKEREQTVSSLRLDVLIKEIYQLPRATALQLIKQKRVKVNFKQVDDGAIQLMKQDMISVKGFGRSKLVEVGGLTRKDKVKVTTARLEDN